MEAVRIENIEQMRREVGIDDAELRDEIRGLAVGDLVKLTFLTSATASETLSVRITSIRGSTFGGELARRPVSGALSTLRAGSPVTFTRANIHSVSKSEPIHEP